MNFQRVFGDTIEKLLTPYFHFKHRYHLELYINFYGLTVKSK